MGVLIKPASSRCNLNCTYCFYLPKMELYPWKDHPKLSIETFDEFLRQYVPMSAPHLSFNWQGGEPTIMGVSFYEQVVGLQRQYARKVSPGNAPLVQNAIQTNGTLLTDDWAKFLKKSRFLVGISIDGPPEIHNRFRVDWSDRPTHDRAMGGIEHLRRHDVPFNVLTVVSKSNVGQPRELLRWLIGQEFEFIQFIPIMEVPPGAHSAADGGVTDESLTPGEWGFFLNEIFDEWLKIGIEKVRLRWFDNLVQMLWGIPSEACTLARTCGYLLLEHNGDCYPCDFFVEKDWLLGNIQETPLEEMVKSERFGRFSKAKSSLHSDCRDCEWLTLCYGECPKYRIANVGTAENALPYFCPSFKQFFGDNYSRLEEVSVQAGRQMGVAVPFGAKSPTDRTHTEPVSIAVIQQRAKQQGMGRNDVCLCGSERKYKRCCESADRNT